MEHIKETLNSDYKFRTLTADDGYIIANVLNGFDADNYIGTKTMVLPAEQYSMPYEEEDNEEENSIK